MFKFEIQQVTPVRNKTNIPNLTIAPTSGMIRINSKATVVLGIKPGQNVAYFSTEAAIQKAVSDGQLKITKDAYEDAEGNVYNVQHYIANFKDVETNITSRTAATGTGTTIGTAIQFTNKTMWSSLNGNLDKLNVYEILTPGIEQEIGEDTITVYELKFTGEKDKTERSEKSEDLESPEEDVPQTNNDVNPFA